MISARAGLGVFACACVLGLACGGRTGIEACVGSWEQCSASAGAPSVSGQRSAPIAGTVGIGGRSVAPVAGAPQGGRAGGTGGVAGGTGGMPGGIGGMLGGIGGMLGGIGGMPGGAGQGGSAGAPPREPPIVLMLLDASSSMFDAQVWSPTYEALLGPGGPIETYQSRVRFGFASYRGVARTQEDDPACADIASVPFAIDNHANIRDAYAALDSRRRGRPYETPTGHALMRVIDALRAEPESAVKHILLISDGAPDTCTTTATQCGQDRTMYAVQRAFELGIVTHAIGIGFGNYYPGCSPDTARCASDHFQDIANAGVGLPVVQPPEQYVTLPCVLETGGELLAHYATQGGTARFHWTMAPGEVAAAVHDTLVDIAP